MSGNEDVFEYEVNGDILVVIPVRDFMSIRDADLRDAYNETYRRLTTEDLKHLVFDFEQLNYFGSTFVGIMIRLAKKTNGNGGTTVLCNLSDEIRSILKQLMLLENDKTASFWKRAQTREIAIEWLQTEFESAG